MELQNQQMEETSNLCKRFILVHCFFFFPKNSNSFCILNKKLYHSIISHHFCVQFYHCLQFHMPPKGFETLPPLTYHFTIFAQNTHVNNGDFLDGKF